MADQVCPRCGSVVKGATDLVSVAVFNHKETPGACVEPETFDDRAAAVYRIVTADNGGESSPMQVTRELERRGWLPEHYSALDVADTVNALRERGKL